MVHDKSRQISKSLSEHKQGSGNILDSIEAVKDIPAENRKMAIRISNSLWNLQKDAELLKVEMERFRFSVKRGHALRFGVVPLQEPSAMFRKFKPLAEYLGRKLGKKIDLNVAVDMESAVKDIGENVTQLCAMGPANYIDANMNYGVKVIAKALRQGKPFHRAAIVTRADSGLRSLKDLRGKTLALVSPKSATGHVMPLATLKDAGITINDLKYYEFLGDHDKVVLAVLNGDYDAGGVMEEAANKLKDKGLVVLQLSLEIPEFNICFNPSVDAETVNVIKDALVALDISNKDEATILKSLGKDCTGFVPATESDYTVFREKIRGIEADLDLGDHYHKLHGSGKDHE
jgi:phosphonate transport system substrate-binding protein